MDEGWIKPINGQRNWWRYKADTDQRHIEVKLAWPNEKKYTTIDAMQFDLMQTRKWRARFISNIWYAEASVRVAGKNTTVQLHRYIHPLIGKIIDHIDGDGLNNVESNLRNGTHGVNQSNLRKAPAGVAEDGNNVVSYWRENGKTVRRYFNYAQLGYDDAWAAAIACRKENAERVFADKLALAAAEPPPMQREYDPIRPHSTGIPGVAEYKKKGIVTGVTCSVTIERKLNQRYFSFSTYGGREAAIAAATPWLEQMRAQRELLPPIADKRKRRKIANE